MSNQSVEETLEEVRNRVVTTAQYEPTSKYLKEMERRALEGDLEAAALDRDWETNSC